MAKPSRDEKDSQFSTSAEDSKIEASLRPESLSDLPGREKEKSALRVLITAAKKRKEPVDHVLFYGPPGLGKTTLAYIVAKEMESNIRITSGPAVERQGDLAAILTNLGEGDVLFIDEIHRLNRGVEEILYPALEDFKLDIVVGKGPSARSIRLELPRFTLIGATTRVGLISSPLRSRFGFSLRLDYYTEEDLVKIVSRAAEMLGFEVDRAGVAEIAARARGTARIALQLLRRVRDYCQVNFDGIVPKGEQVSAALEALSVDKLGLDDLDRKILKVITQKFGGGPVGLTTIAAAVAEDVGTISDVYEPFLIQKGLLKRTPRGRVATKLTYTHLGLDSLGSKDESLRMM